MPVACQKCGLSMPTKANFCPTCGSRAPEVGMRLEAEKVAVTASETPATQGGPVAAPLPTKVQHAALLSCSHCGAPVSPIAKACSACFKPLQVVSGARAIPPTPAGGRPRMRDAKPKAGVGFGRRLGAAAVDLLLWIVVWVVLASINPHPLGWTNLCDVVILLGYYPFFVWLLSCTPGQLLLGIRVVNCDAGHAVGIVLSLRRFLLMLIGSLLLFGWFPVIRSPRGPAWHDRMSGTDVTYRRPVGSLAV